MSRRRSGKGRREQVPDVILDRVRAPVGIVLGGVRENLLLVDTLQLEDIVCFQMDLYPASRLELDLVDIGSVVTSPDLWDLEPNFQTLIYLPHKGGERELKIDMVEQAYHVLKPGGKLIVWSIYRADDLFPPLLKKIFGKVSDFHEDQQSIFICTRPEKDRPRRRHEISFQARIGERDSCRFLSRPGTFSYGRLDNGSRALMETAELQEGQSVLDVGCGCGTNGIFASQILGESGHVTFVDSNVRATHLAEQNAQENGLSDFEVATSAQVEGFQREKFDVVLSNPPYYAHASIARLFVERGWELLRFGGTFTLVTRQPNEMGAIMADVFDIKDGVDGLLTRGYVILQAKKR